MITKAKFTEWFYDEDMELTEEELLFANSQGWVTDDEIYYEDYDISFKMKTIWEEELDILVRKRLGSEDLARQI
ncbi:MAG: hypothetical protein KOO65_08490 [Desulfobacterales bacterium]|nr:hypothetical protein [Desulfobacterales bacterium]